MRRSEGSRGCFIKEYTVHVCVPKTTAFFSTVGWLLFPSEKRASELTIIENLLNPYLPDAGLDTKLFSKRVDEVSLNGVTSLPCRVGWNHSTAIFLLLLFATFLFPGFGSGLGGLWAEWKGEKENGKE